MNNILNTENSSNVPFNILLLGGTGAMGQHLAQILSNKGCHVTVTSRTERKDKTNVKYIKGNAHDLSFIKEILNFQFDVIVDFMSYKTDEFEERYQFFLDKTKHYIFLSSARVYANNNIITEDSPRLLDVSTDSTFLASDEYSLAKARQENLLIKSHKNNYTIIRPYITFSEERLQLGVLEKEEWLYRAIHNRTILFSKDIAENYTTLTYGYDVANAIAELINSDDSKGHCFHITLTKPLKWSEVLDIYLKSLKDHGYNPKVKFINKSLNINDPLFKYQVLYDRYYNRKFSSNKLNLYAPNIEYSNVRTALKQCIDTFLSNPRFRLIDWKKQALTDKITHEITPLSEISGLKNKIRYIIYRFTLK